MAKTGAVAGSAVRGAVRGARVPRGCPSSALGTAIAPRTKLLPSYLANWARLGPN